MRDGRGRVDVSERRNWNAELERVRNEAERERQRIRDELATHRQDSHAHAALTDRLLQGGVEIRKSVEDRLRSLEAFRAQAVLIGGVALIILGALAYAVVAKLIH